MKRVLLGILVLLFVLASAPAWGVSKWDIDATTPYVNGTIADCNATYCYGWKNEANPHLIRWDSDFTENVGDHSFGAVASGEFIREVFATSTTGLVFVVARAADGTNALYRTTDHGDNFTKVLDLGDEGGSPIADVWVIQRGFAEATIGETTTYILGEYNVNGSRTPGGTNDKVRLMQSTNGTTWTALATWNTSGHQITHIHAVRHDTSTGYIYVGFGDAQAESAIIRWDPASGTWADNTSFADYTTRTGFKCVHNAYNYKTVDILFTANYIHLFADDTNAGTKGIWRAAKDLTGFERVMNDTVTDHEGWAGAVTSTGKILFTDEVKGSAADMQGRVWISEDEGATYTHVGYLGLNSATSAAYVRASAFGTKIVLGMISGATKHWNDTAVIYDTGVAYSEEFTPIFHPVFFVGASGTNDAATDRGFVKDDPWRTPQYALTGNRMSLGSRLILENGNFPCDNSTQIAITNALPTTGTVIVEGQGRGASNWYTSEAMEGNYVLYAGGYDNLSMVIRKLSIYALVPTTNNIAALIYAGANGNTGVNIYIRDAAIGNLSYNAAKPTVFFYDGLNIKRSIVYGYPSNIPLWGMKNGMALTLHHSIVSGGTQQVYLSDYTHTTSIINSLLYNFTSRGISYNADVPLVKNSIFYGGAGNLTSMVDGGSATETDAEIDYNIFFNCGDVPWGVDNAGGSHSLISDPKFVSVGSDFRLQSNSPAINVGVDLCATLIDAADFLGFPVCAGGVYVGKGKAPSIGVYNHPPIRKIGNRIMPGVR